MTVLISIISMQTTTVTIRTNKKLKEQAQVFVDGLGITLSAAINIFLNDMITNQRLSFSIEPIQLIENEYDQLPPEVKKSYDALQRSDAENLIYFPKK